MSESTNSVVIVNDINYETYQIAQRTNMVLIALVLGLFAFGIFRYLKNSIGGKQ